jgi:hypothetical protein
MRCSLMWMRCKHTVDEMQPSVDEIQAYYG